MKLFNFVAILANLIAYNTAEIQSDFQQDEDSTFHLNNFENFYQNLIATSSLRSQTFKTTRESESTSVYLEWGSCGRQNDAFVFKNIVLNPNPFVLPGHLQFGFDMIVTQNITDSIKLNIDMKKEVKIFGISTWVPVPCYHHVVGSCTIRDICDLTNFTWCPMQINGKNASCRCPITQGNYSLPTINKELPSIPSAINPSLVEGAYKVKFNFYKRHKKLGCFEVTAHINFS